MLYYSTVFQVFSGIGGSYLAILMASYTYLTHLADPKARMMRVGIAEAATFLAGTVSAFVSGKIVDSLGYVPAFGIALGCQVDYLFCLKSVKAYAIIYFLIAAYIFINSLTCLLLNFI